VLRNPVDVDVAAVIDILMLSVRTPDSSSAYASAPPKEKGKKSTKVKKSKRGNGIAGNVVCLNVALVIALYTCFYICTYIFHLF